MSYHYYGVWDFMNLIKKLQITFTICDLPFRPAVGEVMRQISHLSYYNENLKNLVRFILC